MTIPAASRNASHIPLSGVLFEGRYVRAGWPEATEFDSITALRNRSSVRRQFLDSRPLDAEQNRRWLRDGMRRPHEALLSIRLKTSDDLLGAIGWTAWDPAEASLEIGRVMVDSKALARCRDAFPPDYGGVALDAGIALRDFAFRVLAVHRIYSVFIADNRLARHANLAGGGRIVRTSRMACRDGREVDLVHVELERERWLELTASLACAPAASTQATSSENISAPIA